MARWHNPGAPRLVPVAKGSRWVATGDTVESPHDLAPLGFTAVPEAVVEPAPPVEEPPVDTTEPVEPAPSVPPPAQLPSQPAKAKGGKGKKTDKAPAASAVAATPSGEPVGSATVTATPEDADGA